MRPVFFYGGELGEEGPRSFRSGGRSLIITVFVIIISIGELVIQENIDITVFLTAAIIIVIPNTDDKIIQIRCQDAVRQIVKDTGIARLRVETE